MKSFSEEKNSYLYNLKEFIKSKSKQFKLTIQLHTYYMNKDLGGPLLAKIRDELADCAPDESKATAEALGFKIVRYDPNRRDVDNSINEFYLYEGKISRKLTDSLMLFYLENAGGPVILTFLETTNEPLFFISAPSEQVAMDFLKLHLPEGLS